MANRLTDTTIWKKQKWFKKLCIEHKLAWKYLTDECDHAGIWKIDISELLDDLGLDDFDLEQFLLCCNKDFDKKNGKAIKRERITQINEDYLWITGFMTFQYGGKTKTLKMTNNAVPSAIEILKSFELFEVGISLKYFKIEILKKDKAPESPLEKTATPLPINATPLPELITPLGTPLNPLEGGKDKDKDIDKDIILKEGVIGEENFLIPEMLSSFKKTRPTYPGNVDRDFKPLQSIAIFIHGQQKLNGNHIENKAIIIKKWEQLCSVIANDGFYKQKTLSVISNQIQEIYQIEQHGTNTQITTGNSKTGAKYIPKGTGGY